MATVGELCQGCEQRPPVLVMFVHGESEAGDAALCGACFEALQKQLAGKPGVSVRTVGMEQFVGALRQLPVGMADWVIQAYAGPAEGIPGPCEV